MNIYFKLEHFKGSIDLYCYPLGKDRKLIKVWLSEPSQAEVALFIEGYVGGLNDYVGLSNASFISDFTYQEEFIHTHNGVRQ